MARPWTSCDDAPGNPCIIGRSIPAVDLVRPLGSNDNEAPFVNALIAVICIVAPSISWIAVRWRAATVVQRIAGQALEGCPAPRRAEVVLAVADLARILAIDGGSTVQALTKTMRHTPRTRTRGRSGE